MKKVGQPNRKSAIKGDTKQIATFKATARALGCDESQASFDKALKKIGKAIPKGKAR